MLLAQFVGIVHEIKPNFLRTRAGLDLSHLSPVLITLGHFSGNSRLIVNKYISRQIFVTIAENYDMRLAKVRNGSATTPFDVPVTTETTPDEAGEEPLRRYIQL